VSWAIAILGLLFLVFVHELGHFVVAKSVKARATKFYIGFPPAVLRRQHGDTEYGVGAIPLGGYVRIVGMTRPQKVDLWRIVDAADEAKLRDGTALAAAVDPLERSLAAGRMDEAHDLIPAVVAALEEDRELLNETTYKQAAKDLARMAEELDPRAYWRLPVHQRIAIILAGPMANVITAVVVLAIFFMVGQPIYKAEPVVHDLAAGKPAAVIGVKPGDRIVAIDGKATPGQTEVVTAIRGSHGAPLTLTVQRGGSRLVLPAVKPYYDPVSKTYKLGFTAETVRVGTHSQGPIAATRHAVSQVWTWTTGTVQAIVNIFRPKGTENLSSAVGIVHDSATAVDVGLYPEMLAFISLALAVFNLLPFLPLDGGHILFAILERLRGGRPIPRVVFERVSFLGIAMMLALFWFGLQNDITRLTGP
jgi:regulator of sigma E protease